MPLLDALKALAEHRFNDPNFSAPAIDEKEEFDTELAMARSIMEALIENDALSEENKIIDFQNRITKHRKSFTNQKAVDLIKMSCNDAKIDLDLKVFKIRK